MVTKIPNKLLENPTPASENFIVNPQWQLWGQTTYISKMNSLGTAAQPAVLVSSFTTGNGAPTLVTGNTGELKNGDIGILGSGFQWGYAGVGYQPISGQYLTANRVSSLLANASFVVQGNFVGVSPAASAATSFQAICPGDNGSGGLSACGWGKTSALVVWADDFSVNQCPGAIRVKGIRKSSATQQTTSHFIPAKKLRRYAGRYVTFGVLIYHKTQGGSGTSRVYISDSGTPTYSASGTGAAYSNPNASYGKYEFLKVTLKIGANPTSLEFGVSLDGNSGDIYYIALPTGVFGEYLNMWDLRQRSDELIESVHWNPPLLTPFVINFPATELVTGSGLYGWNNVDMEAISLGTCHSSVATTKAKFEWKSATVGAYIFAADHTANSHLRFGVQAITQVANVNDTDSGEWPLYDDGTISLFGTVASLTGHVLTLDFWDVVA